MYTTFQMNAVPPAIGISPIHTGRPTGVCNGMLLLRPLRRDSARWAREGTFIRTDAGRSRRMRPLGFKVFLTGLTGGQPAEARWRPPSATQCRPCSLCPLALGFCGLSMMTAYSSTSTQSTASGPRSSSAEVSRRMRSTRRRDTAPEVALRRVLHRRGLRYLVDASVDGTRRRVDLAFRGPKIAVLVHGCFWHSCPQHATAPKSNERWWADKLEANRRRDADTILNLESAGWITVVVWEHEDPEVAADRVEAIVRPTRQGRA